MHKTNANLHLNNLKVLQSFHLEELHLNRNSHQYGKLQFFDKIARACNDPSLYTAYSGEKREENPIRNKTNTVRCLAVLICCTVH